MQNADNDNATDSGAESVKRLSPAAQRALKEAEERRRQQADLQLPPETGGRGGSVVPASPMRTSSRCSM